jgi:hypothetical protein
MVWVCQRMRLKWVGVRDLLTQQKIKVKTGASGTSDWRTASWRRVRQWFYYFRPLGDGMLTDSKWAKIAK